MYLFWGHSLDVAKNTLTVSPAEGYDPHQKKGAVLIIILKSIWSGWGSNFKNQEYVENSIITITLRPTLTQWGSTC